MFSRIRFLCLNARILINIAGGRRCPYYFYAHVPHLGVRACFQSYKSLTDFLVYSSTYPHAPFICWDSGEENGNYYNGLYIGNYIGEHLGGYGDILG